MKLQTILESIHAKNISHIIKNIILDSIQTANKHMEIKMHTYVDIFQARTEFIQYFLKILILQFRSKLSSDVRFVRDSGSYGMVNQKMPNIIWLDRLYNVLDENVRFIKSKNNCDITTTGINKMVEVLTHEYTHIRQGRKLKTSIKHQGYWNDPAEIDAHVSGWVSEFNQLIGDTFSAKQMIQTFNIFFDRYNVSFDKLPDEIKQKYLKKMYIALTSEHGENYLTTYKKGDVVYCYLDHKTGNIINQPNKCIFIDYHKDNKDLVVIEYDTNQLTVPVYVISPYYKQDVQSTNSKDWSSWYKIFTDIQ